MTKYCLKNYWEIAILFVTFIFLFGFKQVQTTLADAAPPPAPSGSDIFPSIETTNVRMISERVLIDILGYSAYSSEKAYVTAQFMMRNLGDTTEQMKVRFPLNHSEYNLEYEIENNAEFCEFISPFPPIDEVTVWVNGSKVDTTKTTITTQSPYTAEYVTLPCWAYFDIIFPPGEDVTIKVAYAVSGYIRDPKLGFVEFTYILGTGAGWKDTIGKADIIARLPYDVSELNFDSCFPEDCELSGKEISWHYEDFEPSPTIDRRENGYMNTTFKIVRPSFWQRVLAEQAHLANSPNDGEAWGRLGKTYKEIINSSKGLYISYSKPGERLFELSREAYQKAVDFLPNDADWHYGFADLLCGNVHSESDANEWIECIAQLKLALDIKPDHEMANELLQGIANYSANTKHELEIVDLSGVHPDYLILTPQPSATATEAQPIPPRIVITKTSAPTKTATPQATATASQTPTPKTPTVALTDTVVVLETNEKPSSLSEDTNSNWSVYIGAGLFFIVIVIVVLIWRKK